MKRFVPLLAALLIAAPAFAQTPKAEGKSERREACKDKKGEELRACIREHRSKTTTK